MTSARSRAISRGSLLRIGALVAAGALALSSCSTSPHSTASLKPAHVAGKVGTSKPALPGHTATVAALARVHTLAKLGMPRAYIGANTADPDDGIKGTVADAHYCNGCNPPLAYKPQAPIMNTTGAAGVTITPIYWAPTGQVGFPAHYQTIINAYIKNAALASGSTGNVYSVSSEYYSTDAAGNKTYLRYKLTAGTPIVDTSPYPPQDAGCVVTDPLYSKCVDDGQERTELTRLSGLKKLPLDLAHIYPIFLAPNVETYDATGSNVNNFCGYHGNFAVGSTYAIYANEVYSDGHNCGSGEDPNGLLSADTAIDTLSHEISEAMTDPTDNRAWNDGVGYEIGDVCSGSYGPLQGFATNPYNPSDQYTAYNQTIGNGHYYTQTEFSNAAYAKLGVGAGCIVGESALTAKTIKRGITRAGTAAPVVATINSDPFPNSFPADGTSTSDLDIAVSDPDGFAIENDRIHYTIYAVQGDGVCGTVNVGDALTDSSGHSHVTYTASTSNVECAVVANELYGGKSATSYLYQGTFQAQAVRATNTYPTSIRLGPDGKRFQVKFLNPTVNDSLHNQVHLQLTAGDGSTNSIDASQVHLTYALAKNGPWLPVTVSGSTSGAIQANILPPTGVTIAAQKSLTVYFHMQLAKTVDTSGGGAGFFIENYLEQINTASGAISTYGDTLAYSVTVLK